MKDYFGYQDKVCVVTGAASGIGKATTEMLVDLGARVYALDMNETNVSGISKSLLVNLNQKESIDEVFQKLPERIDRFFGIAGVSSVKTNYYVTVTINFIANKYITDTYLDKRMPDGGAIAYVSSAAGTHWDNRQKELRKIVHAKDWDATVNVMRSIASESGYGAMAYFLSKRGLNLYAVTKMAQYGKQKRNIRINTIMPAGTATGMKDEFAKLGGGDRQMLSSCGYAVELAQPYQMAQPLVFLNSDMASYINGQCLPIDFGEEGIKTLKIKKDLQDISCTLKIYNLRFVQNILDRFKEKDALKNFIK
jgi:NAD(P)-dependent dehydrogenase (short-subunit alcohol dehydrogenase family)